MGMINVYNPEGKFGTIPEENLEAALKDGYRLETPREIEKREFIEPFKGVVGDILVGGAQAVDEALLGVPEMIFERVADPKLVENVQALKADHEPANTIGGIGGFAASMYAPGVKYLFKGAEKAGEMVASRLAGKALPSNATLAQKVLASARVKAPKYATEGLILSAPELATEAIFNDHEAMGETLLAGVGIGALFGAGGALAKELGTAAASKVRDVYLKGRTFSDEFREKAAGKAAEALNPTLAQQERILEPKGMEAVGRTLIDEGIVTPMASARDMFERLDKRSAEVGKQVGESLQKFDEIAQAMNEYDAAVGRPLTEFTISPAELAERLEREVVGKHKNTPAYRSQVERFGRDLEALREVPGVWSIAEANAQKAAYGDVINNWGLDQPINKKFLQNIYDTINQAVEERIDRISKHEALEQIAADGTDLLADFKKLKTTYGHLESAEIIAKKSAAREDRNNDFSLTSFITGGSTLLAGSYLFDDPYIATVTGAAGLFGRRFLRDHGNQLMAYGYEKAGLLLSEKAMIKATGRIDQIDHLLERMSQKAPNVRADTAAIGAATRSDVYKSLFNLEVAEGTSPSAKAERYAKLSDRMLELQGNPAHAMNRISDLTWPVSEGGAPNIGAEFNRKLAEAYQYLMQEMPRPKRPPNPFIAKQKYVPSDFELAAFEQKAQVVADPFSVLGELEAGTLSRHHVAALRTVYPKIYEMIRDKVFEASTSQDFPLTYAQRLKLGILLDLELDPTMSAEAIQNFQAVYAAGHEIEDPSAEPAPKPVPGAAKLKLGENTQTRIDRIRSGH